MLRKKLYIFKWILLLAISRANSFTILKFNNIEEDELVSKFVNLIKKPNVDNEENNSNGVKVTGLTYMNGVGYRRSHNVKDYLHKRLVKRIVPHGYSIANLEYDEKFNTLYKPLVRIHKNKPTVDALGNAKDTAKYDLVIILDDKHSEIVLNRTKDDALLKPFAIDSMDIKYLSNDRDPVEYIMNEEKNSNLDHSKSNRLIVVDDFEKSKVEKTEDESKYNSLEYWNPNEFYDLLRHKYRAHRQKKHHRALNKHKLFNQIAHISGKHADKKISNDGNKEMLQFGTVGQLVAKQFQNKKRKVEDMEVDMPLRFDKYTQHQYKWFVPPGHPNLKPRIRNDITDIFEKRNDIKNTDEHFVVNEYDLPIDSLKQSNKESLQLKNHNYIRERLGLFGPVGKLSGKQHRHDEGNLIQLRDSKNVIIFIPFSSQQDLNRGRNIVKKDSKHAKLFGPMKEYIEQIKRLERKRALLNNSTIHSSNDTLLKQISQLKNDKNNKILKMRLYLDKKLRTTDFQKSGEDPDTGKVAAALAMDSEASTEKPSKEALLQSNSFWNYWTYNRPIHQDNCPGMTIESGGVCIQTPPH